MSVVFFILCLIAMIFTWCFLLAAVLTFATFDPQPLDRETEWLLTWGTFLGGGWLVPGLVVVHQWRRCQLGRRLFYTALACGALTFVAGKLADLAGTRYEASETAPPIHHAERTG